VYLKKINVKEMFLSDRLLGVYHAWNVGYFRKGHFDLVSSDRSMFQETRKKVGRTHQSSVRGKNLPLCLFPETASSLKRKSAKMICFASSPR
jgi:hypothetical protein